MNEEGKGLLFLAGIGALVGLGQLLASKEILTKRIIIGRMLSSAGLGASASAILTFMPSLPIEAQFGIAAAFASLGTSGLERLFQKWIDR